MMFKLLKVSGESLSPAYQDGDFVLVSKIPYLFGTVRPGDVVVFRHRLYGTMIKRVVRAAPDKDEVEVIGTDDHSADSRTFGAIGRGDILGKVIWHVGRRGET
jgi:signal peptidase I